jgi:asparagine synthase (glutamine-hydrolysing)
MCGIAGFLTNVPGADSTSVLRRMTDILTHRGPDETGVYSDKYAYLGHRRLSIIDLATGQQPMPNEDRTRWISYNGEIFNHSDVRPELESAGHIYKSHCDTETILHAYEQFGPECLSRFRGMFAFVIWDSRAQTLFCARDRLGIKPFYYYFDGRLFAFASEIKALLAHPSIRTELNESVLSEYLAFGYISSEETLFRGIRKLMPGHHMTLRLSSGEITQKIQRYWDAPASPESIGTEEDWIAECRRRLEETVRMRLMSDVPLGMFLSGGLDSSAIAALVRRMVPERLKTFSVGYAEEQYSELGFARRVADHIDSEHHEVRVGMEDFFNVLPKLVWHEDEPITWPSSVSLHFVSELASRQVKVVLTGEGSDELFAGYHRYKHFLFNQRWLPYYKAVPGPLRRALRAHVSTTALISASLRRKVQHTFVGLGETVESLLLDNFYSAFSAEAQAKLLRRGAANPYATYMRYWNAAAGAPPLQRLLYADQKTYLVELLMKQDQMSMSTSIESRVPLLDHTFVEFAARIPTGLKLRGDGKYIFKKAVEDILPADIIYRRKMGFPTPMRQWLREERSQPLYSRLRDPKGLLAEYVNHDELERLIQLQQDGQHDCTDRLWRLLNLQIWGEVFFTGRMSADSALVGQPAASASA